MIEVGMYERVKKESFVEGEGEQIQVCRTGKVNVSIRSFRVHQQ